MEIVVGSGDIDGDDDDAVILEESDDDSEDEVVFFNSEDQIVEDQNTNEMTDPDYVDSEVKFVKVQSSECLWYGRSRGCQQRR